MIWVTRRDRDCREQKALNKLRVSLRGVCVWVVNSTVTKHSDYFVWKDMSQRVTQRYEDTSRQDMSEFLHIKTPLCFDGAFPDSPPMSRFQNIAAGAIYMHTYIYIKKEFNETTQSTVWIIGLMNELIWGQRFSDVVCFTCMRTHTHTARGVLGCDTVSPGVEPRHWKGLKNPDAQNFCSCVSVNVHKVHKCIYALLKTLFTILFDFSGWFVDYQPEKCPKWIIFNWSHFNIIDFFWLIIDLVT